MRISEVSALVDLSKDTIRYYEKMGLLHPYIQGGKRIYDEKDIQRLNEIKLLKNAFFSINEIRYFILMDDKFENIEAIKQINDDDYDGILNLIESKITTIQLQIEHLHIAQNTLKSMENKLTNLERKR